MVKIFVGIEPAETVLPFAEVELDDGSMEEFISAEARLRSGQRTAVSHRPAPVRRRTPDTDDHRASHYLRRVVPGRLTARLLRVLPGCLGGRPTPRLSPAGRMIELAERESTE